MRGARSSRTAAGVSGSSRRRLGIAVLSCALAACDGSAGGRQPSPAVAPAGAPTSPSNRSQRDDSPPGAPVATAAPGSSASADRAAGSPPGSAPSAPPPLDAPAAFVDLPVDGFAPAVAALPIGARGRLPVLLATHGNYDRPEWQCEVWREIIGRRGFVLCPRGVARPDSPGSDDIRFTYTNNQALEREIAAAMAALVRRFPDHVDPSAPIYTGFSLGAIMGVSIASRDPSVATRAVLVEGGHDKWTAAVVKAYAATGGRRVLFACGQGGCVAGAQRPAALLEKAGVATRIVHGKGVGHGYGGAVAAEVKAAFDWVVEGDPRWAARAPEKRAD
jgi:predicted esterase